MRIFGINYEVRFLLFEGRRGGLNCRNILWDEGSIRTFNPGMFCGTSSTVARAKTTPGVTEAAVMHAGAGEISTVN